MTSMRWRSVITLALWLALAGTGRAGTPAPPPVEAAHGMVVTSQRLASEIGAEILRQGGNAVDAAVAVGYALAVVYPAAGNIGGGGFMTAHFADGRATFLDFRERAPQAATPTMYLDANGGVVPRLSIDGWLAVGVPGSVAGFEAARQRYGTLPRETLMAPAIRLARDGFVLSGGDVALFNLRVAALRRDPAAAAIFLKDGRTPYEAGDRLVQSDLADTLALISHDGAAAFYQGAIADRIVAASDSGHGILRKADFERYAVREMPPVGCTYRGYEILSAPPPSSGGVILCEILNVLEGYPLATLGFHTPDEVHLLVEAMRHAYRDRNSRLGDPAFIDNPVALLLDKAYAATIRAAIVPGRATPSADLAPAADTHEGTQTTHYSIVDAAGNAVAVTYTLNDAFGAKVVAAGTGITMNDEMDDFTAKPGVANLYGLVQQAPNAIQPGKTPLSSMTPTIVLKDGNPVMVIGSPGGSRIITIALEAIVNVIDHGMTIQEAIDAPRLHHQFLPDTVYLEPDALAPENREALARMGYGFTDKPPWGVAAGILRGGPSLAAPSADPHALFGASDPRGKVGAAIGY